MRKIKFKNCEIEKLPVFLQLFEIEPKQCIIGSLKFYKYIILMLRSMNNILLENILFINEMYTHFNFPKQ